jgi:hypothetical protein
MGNLNSHQAGKTRALQVEKFHLKAVRYVIVAVSVWFAGSLLTFPADAQSKPQRLKVQCSSREKSRFLWQGPELSKIAGEVKCGQKVIVIGQPLWLGSFYYIPVVTADKKIGYLSSDALEKKSGPSWREVVAGTGKAMEAYARSADPHIAWCDSHAGFSGRVTDADTVRVTDSNTGQPIGTGTIAHTYIVCKDGTRIKES